MSLAPRHKMSRQEYATWLRLFGAQKWLGPKEGEFYELMDVCETLEEQSLVCDLLHRFLYLEGAAISVHLREMVRHVVGIAKKKIRNPYYLDSIYGKLQFWTSIEPNNRFAEEAMQKIRVLRSSNPPVD